MGVYPAGGLGQWISSEGRITFGGVEIGADAPEQPQSRVSPISGVAPPVATRFPPGQSGNPGGRAKASRLVSTALAELQDAPGEDAEACIAAFKAARGAKLCGADHKAIALLRKETNDRSREQVSAIECALDRLEGKVPSTTSLVGADGGPLRIEWVNDWRRPGGD